jgi:hypothetical protein
VSFNFEKFGTARGKVLHFVDVGSFVAISVHVSGQAVFILDNAIVQEFNEIEFVYTIYIATDGVAISVAWIELQRVSTIQFDFCSGFDIDQVARLESVTYRQIT